MKVFHVMEREMTGSMRQLGEIISTWGSSNDRFHPFERWPRTHFEGPDGPPTVGRIGTRAAAQFVMTQYDIGERIRISAKFMKPTGFDGYQIAEGEEIGNGKLLLRAIIDMNTRGISGTLLWLFVMRPFHEAVIYDLFDKVERDLGSSPQAHEWSLWVKFVRWTKRRNSSEYQRLHRGRLKEIEQAAARTALMRSPSRPLR
jgi:hypothetical protein